MNRSLSQSPIHAVCHFPKPILYPLNYIFQNLITFRIYERDFDNAIKYLELTRIQKIQKTNYYWLNINYLGELITFVKEGSFNSFDKIRHYINIIEDLGHTEQATMLKDEVTRLTNGTRFTSNKYVKRPTSLHGIF